MIDKAKQIATYEVGGRVLYMRPLTLQQRQDLERCEAWQQITVTSKSENTMNVMLTAEVLAPICSIVLTDEAGGPVTVTVEETRRWSCDFAMELNEDFFSLNPRLAAFFTTLLIATLNLPGAAASLNGKAEISGSTSAASPAEATSPSRPS